MHRKQPILNNSDLVNTFLTSFTILSSVKSL